MIARIAPSILTADFTRLGDQVDAALAAGAGVLHIDVMDGHFVPNITIGPLLVRALQPVVRRHGVPLDVHLMIAQPARYIDAFADAGADIITVHAEASTHLHRTIQAIQARGVKAGVALNPATPLSALEEVLPLLDLVLIMSVNPGFGGQTYIPGSTDKIRRMRAQLDAIGSAAELEVDGGIKAHNAAEVVAAGATILVAGSAVFNPDRSIAASVTALLEAMTG